MHVDEVGGADDDLVPPCSAASTWASWNASTAGLYSEYFTLDAPFVSSHVAASPSTGSATPGFQKRKRPARLSPGRP
ncbi:hypothetical protein [Micromonospora rhizosphaerae]|uniref:hypothetical protein n=1 Tax=Micromonospora rhizosphaerae TaxID=568872 RepID=UPI00114D3826|nr:hypothetical protein [Micromonospora rhizosphaerae]